MTEARVLKESLRTEEGTFGAGLCLLGWRKKDFSLPLPASHVKSPSWGRKKLLPEG